MLVRVGALPAEPLKAAAQFYAEVLPRVEAESRDDCTLVFPPADHTHRAWRLAAVQELAREYAPRRVNGLVSDDEVAITAAERYLASAPGVTGQLLALDGHGAQ
jgi:hypothetical protein